MFKLSICIPTYNRPESVYALVRQVVEQWSFECELLILDNASTISVEDLIAESIARLPSESIRVIRNGVNIGACANALRCIEMALGEWIWIIGDDDKLCPNGIADVLAVIATQPDAVYLNFATSLLAQPLAARRPLCGCGVSELIACLDDFANFLFISAGVYHSASIKPYLPIAYSYINTFAPHVALLLLSFRANSGRFVLYPANIVIWQVDPSRPSWLPQAVNPGLTQLLAVLEKPEDRRLLAQKMDAYRTTPQFDLRSSLELVVHSRAEDLHHVQDRVLERAYLTNLSRRRSVPIVLGTAFIGSFIASLANPIRALHRLLNRLRGRAWLAKEEFSSQVNLVRTIVKNEGV